MSKPLKLLIEDLEQVLSAVKTAGRGQRGLSSANRTVAVLSPREDGIALQIGAVGCFVPVRAGRLSERVIVSASGLLGLIEGLKKVKDGSKCAIVRVRKQDVHVSAAALSVTLPRLPEG